ncbi:related to protoporphyrinogen oxidase [Phialocephala subalpina]|uniref:Related to protoporphyrinogen oxidase n=1 Tax=Phialocephala subalpina TaxID=576137 RepID=A0A1L7XU04_9HELO|nr:related to protoporphyrinogen oxidase [Phialocephala subalpina]
MPSYVVTGASRGIGASKSENQVFGIIRNVQTATKLYDLAKSHPNIHIIVAEVTNSEQVEEAAAKVAEITGGKLDVLINNAGGGGPNTRKAPGDYVGQGAEMKSDILEAMDINFFSAVFTTNAFLPLIRKGDVKKIITISSGMADEHVILTTELPFAIGYAASKAGLNVTMAKYAVQLKGEGIICLTVSPGWVRTEAAEDFQDGMFNMVLSAFQKLAPDLKDMISVEESVAEQLALIDRVTVKDTGKFVSQHGDRNWF